MDTRDLIITSHEAGDSRDAIIISLVGECGLSLNAATKAYAAVAKAEGWTTGRESRKDEALALLRGWAPLASDWTADVVRESVADLTDRLGIAESTARDYCKAYSEELGVPYPVEDPRAAMFAFLVDAGRVAEPGHTDDIKVAFKEFAGEDGLGRSPSNVNEYWKGFELAMAIVAARNEEAGL